MAPSKSKTILDKLKKEEPRLEAYVNELEVKLKDIIDLKVQHANNKKEKKKLIIERRRVERELA